MNSGIHMTLLMNKEISHWKSRQNFRVKERKQRGRRDIQVFGTGTVGGKDVDAFESTTGGLNIVWLIIWMLFVVPSD